MSATPDRTPPVEEGRFRLHKFQQPIGEEVYQIRGTASGLEARMDFRFQDRGQEVSLSAEFAADPSLNALHFRADGTTARSVEVHVAVDARERELRLRNRDCETSVPRPERFFPTVGYAPIAQQMLLVRYWLGHGSPPELPTYPAGRVRIALRGQDRVRLGDRTERLDRVSVEGLIWGRESLWFDRDRSLVAAVTIDAELDHFEAVRQGAESALGTFIGLAGADGMASLGDTRDRVSSSATGLLAFVHCTVIDGTGAGARPGATVVVRDDRILQVGPGPEVPVPRGATVVEGRGRALLPGLWDMHAHFQQVEWGPIYLAAGVTTVRDCGNELEFLTAVRDAISSGRGIGPRILAAGVVDGSGPSAVGIARVDTEEQAVDWVDRYRAAGFQQIKVYSSLSKTALTAVVRAAHRRGLTVTGHIPMAVSPREAVEAGQDQINHIGFVASMMLPSLGPEAPRSERLAAMARLDVRSADAREAVEFLRRHGTVVDPTLALQELYTISSAHPVERFEPGAAKLPPELAARFLNPGPDTADTRQFAEIFRRQVELVGELHRAGIVLVAGTDQAVPGHSLHREVELYVEAGMTPVEAIRAASAVPARVMGLGADVGTIEPGKRADLILVRGNPLAQIRDLRNVERVLTGGRLYEAADLWRSVGFTP